MRLGNVLVVVTGGAALITAAWIAWRGRRSPLIADRELPTTGGASALDALRSIAAIVGAGVVAGFLVPGLGGRLYMRMMAATSGAGAQGKLTEAEEIVGEITLGGTVGFVIFVGLVVPGAAAFAYLALRHFLPGPVGLGGLMFGVVLLGVFGVGDPMSPDNVDFEVLEPLWLAVLGIVVLALLYGLTFGALAARFDRGLRPLGSGWRAVPGHVPLLFALLPPFLAVTVPYVAVRSFARGRTEPLLERRPVRMAGLVLVCLATALCAALSIVAAVDILT
jgi:hypothetical protein